MSESDVMWEWAEERHPLADEHGYAADDEAVNEPRAQGTPEPGGSGFRWSTATEAAATMKGSGAVEARVKPVPGLLWHRGSWAPGAARAPGAASVRVWQITSS